MAPGLVIGAESTTPAHRAAAGGRGRVDPDERRSRLLCNPQPGAPSATRGINEHRPLPDGEQSEQPAGLTDIQEADVGELLGKVPAIGIRPPDAVERRAARKRIVDGAVGVADVSNTPSPVTSLLRLAALDGSCGAFIPCSLV
jgi:hypothetical protein